MKIIAKQPFESKKIPGKMIRAGKHDIDPTWAKELIEQGVAIPAEVNEFNPLADAEKRDETAPKPTKKKKSKQ